jgi:LmbE family N-acetylglucosaminyl deacetylase
VTRVLVVAAHPDDEAVGCGGTLRRHVLAGDTVTAIHLTSGEAGGHGLERAGGVREEEAHEAARILGIGHVEFWREPDGALRAREDLVVRLGRCLHELEPARVMVPQERDGHPDHRAAARIVRRTVERLRRRPEVLQCEIWTPIEHIDEVVDISDHLEEKLEAIRAYRSQCAVMRLDDAFEGLARYRGEMHSWPGGRHAEVFTAM